MKQKVTGCLALFITSVFAYALKANPLIFTGAVYKLNNLSTPYDPLAYSTSSIPANVATACPSFGKICYIDVNTSDVYDALNAPSPSYIGKPKVDIQTVATGELADDIHTALITTGETTTPVNGRVFYERN